MLAHITYGNSDRKEMFIIRKARNLTTIKKSLSSHSSTWLNNEIFHGYCFYSRIHPVLHNFIYTRRFWLQRITIKDVLWEENIVWKKILQEVIFSAKTAFLQLKLHSKFLLPSHTFFCILCKNFLELSAFKVNFVRDFSHKFHFFLNSSLSWQLFISN